MSKTNKQARWPSQMDKPDGKARRQSQTGKSGSQTKWPMQISKPNDYVCKLGYLTPCDSFSSYHTTQVFSMSKRINCQNTGLIYLVKCTTCESSYLG